MSDENQILEFFYVPGGLFCCVIAAFFILYGWVFHHIKFPGCSIRVSTTFDIGRYIFCILAFQVYVSILLGKPVEFERVP